MERRLLKYGTEAFYKVSPMTDLPLIEIMIGAGSLLEADMYDKKKSGISHLLEHMMFKSCGEYSSEEFAFLCKEGGIYRNALTCWFGTEYIFTLPDGDDNELNNAINLMMIQMNKPNFDVEELEREKEVVIQEIQMSKAEKDDVEFTQTASLLFDDARAIDVAGSEEIVKDISDVELKQYMLNTYTRPNTKIVVMHKDITVIEEILSRIDNELFMNRLLNRVSISDVEPIKNRYNLKFKDKVEGVTRLRFDEKGEELPTSTIQVIYKIPVPDYKKSSYTDILGLILGSSFIGKINKRIREDLGLSYSVGAYSRSAGKNTDILYIYATTENSKENINTIINEILDIMSDICNTITEREFNIAKKEEIRKVAGMESSGHLARVALNHVYNTVVYEDDLFDFRDDEFIDKKHIIEAVKRAEYKDFMEYIKTHFSSIEPQLITTFL